MYIYTCTCTCIYICDMNMVCEFVIHVGIYILMLSKGCIVSSCYIVATCTCTCRKKTTSLFVNVGMIEITSWKSTETLGIFLFTTSWIKK